MIEWGTGANKTQVDCLTRRDDLEIELQLSKRRHSRNLPASVVLEEPTGLEFATLRKQAIAADTEVNEKFPRPDPVPDEIPGESPMERALRNAEYQREVSDWLDARHNYRTDPDTAVYANVIVEAVNTLTEHTITIGDLRPECFKVTPVMALLEVWETPLGGPVSPAETPRLAEPATPPTAQDDASPNANAEQPSPDSPASTRSSDPGTEPSRPSPPQSSTR